jgi:hypothetical protein
MKFIVPLVLALSLAVATPVLAEKPVPIDPSILNIAGVKLGMTQQEAKKAITATLKLGKGRIKDSIIKVKSTITGKEEPNSFTVKYGVSDIAVIFTANVDPKVKATSLVSYVSYEMPWTEVNVKAMKESAIEKYGPSSMSVYGMSDVWCVAPEREKDFGCGYNEGPKMELAGQKLTLSDRVYFRKWQEWQERKNSGKPYF